MERMDRTSVLAIDPQSMYALSPYLYMQFMEPLGADAFLSKPYDANDLFAIVQNYFSSNTPIKKNKITTLPSSNVATSDTEDSP